MNCSHYQKVISVVFLMTFTSKVWAVPSAYSNKCADLTFINDTNSTLLRDNEDCQTLWVLPPTSGLTQMSGFTPNANLNFCSSVKKLQTSAENISIALKRATEDLLRNMGELEKANQIYTEAKTASFEYQNQPIIQQIRELKAKIVDNDDKIEAMIDKISNCTENCKDLKEDYRAKREENKSHNQELSELQQENRKIYRKYEIAKANLEAAEATKIYLEELQIKKDKAIAGMYDMVHGYLLHYSKLEGGYAHLDYNTSWDANVIALERKYGGRYDFKAIPTRNAKIYANFVGSNNEATYISSMPAILDYSFAGLKFTPWGGNNSAELSALPNALAGAVRLSLMGGCPLYYENFFGTSVVELKIAQKIDSQLMNFSVMANYEFPSAFKFNVTASYNLYKFYEKIVSSSTKRGFFRKKTSQSVSEKNISTDEFKIEWQDEDNLYTKNEKEEITNLLRDELTDRVLHKMAIPVNEKPGDLITPLSDSTPSGAMTFARGFKQTCGRNIYCQGVSWILVGLDATFGGASAVNEFRSTYDFTARETWSSSETRWRPAATGFVSVNN